MAAPTGKGIDYAYNPRPTTVKRRARIFARYQELTTFVPYGKKQPLTHKEAILQMEDEFMLTGDYIVKFYLKGPVGLTKPEGNTKKT